MAKAKFDIDAVVKEFNDLRDEALALLERLRNLGKEGKSAPPGEIAQLKALAKSAAKGLDAVREAATAQHESQKAEVKVILGEIDLSLEDPGLDASVREALTSMKHVREAELLRLENQDATDFGDLLTPADVNKIEADIEAAQDDVKKKKKAAELVAAAMTVADVAATIAGKVLKAAVL